MFHKCRFLPQEIIFVPTQACNLHCAHCFVPQSPAAPDTQTAVRFLEDAAADGIEYVGFSGGEPFLNLSFLCTVIKNAVAHGLLFDRLMTNATWWQTEAKLKAALQAVFDAGFDGTFGISFDAFHAQNPERIATFIRAAQELWQTRNGCVLVCVKKDAATVNKTASMMAELARALGADAVFADSETNPRRKADITDAPTITDSASTETDHTHAAEAGAFAAVPAPLPVALRYRDKLTTFCDDGRAADEIAVITVDYVPYDVADASFWQADEWFTEDFCAGPGNVFYVHGNGDVAACCGYANECPELILGNINTMSYAQIKKAAAQSCKRGFLRTVYVDGLLKTARAMEKKGAAFPGKGRTRDNCFFCRYLLLHKDGMPSDSHVVQRQRKQSSSKNRRHAVGFARRASDDANNLPLRTDGLPSDSHVTQVTM